MVIKFSKNSFKEKRRSFTLIELVMVIVLMGVVALMGFSMLFAATRAWTFQVRRNELAEASRLALDRMIREIRDIKNATSVTSATSSILSFTDAYNSTVSFSLSSNSLERSINSTANSLVSNLDSLTFTYYDSSGSAIASPTVSPSSTNIKRIEITLNLSLEGELFSIKSAVSPRRLQ